MPSENSNVAPAIDPASPFAPLATALAADPGYAMLTILLYDIEAGQGRRVYSSDPDNYPEGGFKPIPVTDWVDQVLIRQENFVAHKVADFQPHYSDWEKLQNMGLVSGMNLPVIIDGKAVGSINLTARSEGYYTADRETAVARHHDLAAAAIRQVMTDAG